MIRVVLVDDQAVVRAGFRVILDTAGDIDVVGEASTGADAVAVVRRLQPDVVCMDVRMPGGDGLEATRAILGGPGSSPPRVLVVTTFDLDDYVFGALEAGASGFVLKDADPEVLVEAIRRLAEGEGVIDPSVTGRVITEFARRQRPVRPEPEGLEQLTSREREIIRLLAAGRSNAEIAEELFIETTTVKTHLSRVLTKTGARDRLQVAVWAHTHGLA